MTTKNVVFTVELEVEGSVTDLELRDMAKTLVAALEETVDLFAMNIPDVVTYFVPDEYKVKEDGQQ